jgi:DNA helicase-2/ATP-dependent DNA helicase PcrA
MRDESVSGRQKVDNVERLRSVIETFAQVNNSIVEFLTFVGEAKDNKDGDAVKLLTVHAAKGLEFDTVFIAGATDRMMPHYRSKLQNEIEEERRLFYVAMTRAKNNLVITYPRLNGKNTQSPFIAEMRSTSRSLQTQGPLSQLQKGMRIRHPQFGSGKVISIRKDYQDKDQAVIQFSTGLKTLLLEYAPITVE